MNHSFNVAVAEKFGVNAAILFESIMFWCKKNEANGMNIHEGRAWTYNSIKAFTKLYPYMTENVIRYSLKKLVDAGMILTGNYSDDKRDRSLWYAIGDVANCICDDFKMDNGNSTDCICENSQMDSGKFSNGFENNPECITVINTDINDSSLSTTKTTTRAREDEPVKTDTVNPDLQRVVKSYQTQIGAIPNGRAFELLTSYVDDLGADAVIVAIEETNLQQPAQPWSWLKKILDGFADNGVHSAEAAKAAVADHRRAAARSALPRAAPTGQDRFNYQQHTYTEADFGAEFYYDPLKDYGKTKEDST